MIIDDDDDQLGYKRPPQWAQFRKGQSGNPNGRPKKKVAQPPAADISDSSMVDDIFRAELARLMPVREGGKSREMTILELVTRAQTQAAIRGDVRAQKEVLERSTALEQRDQQRDQTKLEKQLSDYRRIANWKAERAKIWNAAIQRGEKEPAQPWPHPDDIILIPETTTWRVRGPYDEIDVPFYEYCHARRDQYFGMMCLHVRSRARNAKFYQELYTTMWMCFDVMLPQRWQMDEDSQRKIFAVFMTVKLVDLKRLVHGFTGRAEALAPPPPTPAARKEIYRGTNTSTRPLLKVYGYRSLAEFEHAYELQGESMEWPKENSEG
jgi:Family of unknown function (DUF5681)